MDPQQLRGWVENEDVEAIEAAVAKHGAAVWSTPLDGGGNTILHEAASKRKYAVIRKLVDLGAPRDASNAGGETLLTKLIEQGGSPHHFTSARTTVIAWIAEGFWPKEELDGLSQPDASGARRALRVPVVAALQAGVHDVGQALVENGVSLLRRSPAAAGALVPQKSALEKLMSISSFDHPCVETWLTVEAFARAGEGADSREWIAHCCGASDLRDTPGQFLPRACSALVRAAKLGGDEAMAFICASARMSSMIMVNAILSAHGDLPLAAVREPGTNSNVLHCHFESTGFIYGVLEKLFALIPDAHAMLQERNAEGKTPLDVWVARSAASLCTDFALLDRAMTFDLAQPLAGLRCPLGLALASSSPEQNTLRTVVDRVGKEVAAQLVDEKGNGLFHIAANRCWRFEDACNYLMSQGLDPYAPNAEGKSPVELVAARKDLMAYPSTKKFVASLQRKRKAGGSGSAGGGGGAGPVKKLKKEKIQRCGGEATMYMLRPYNLEWTGNGFKELYDFSAVRFDEPPAEYAQLVAYLREIESQLEDITLRAGEGNCPAWTPFIITNSAGSHELALQRVLKSQEAWFTRTLIARKKYFFQHDYTAIPEDVYDDEDLPKVARASEMIKKNFTSIGQLVPSGSLDSGNLPLFIAGNWDDATIAGLCTHWVWT